MRRKLAGCKRRDKHVRTRRRRTTQERIVKSVEVVMSGPKKRNPSFPLRRSRHCFLTHDSDTVVRQRGEKRRGGTSYSITNATRAEYTPRPHLSLHRCLPSSKAPFFERRDPTTGYCISGQMRFGNIEILRREFNLIKREWCHQKRCTMCKTCM